MRNLTAGTLAEGVYEHLRAAVRWRPHAAPLQEPKTASLRLRTWLQEVTENIYALLSAKGWWRRYVASPVTHDRPYFTAVLHLRDAVHDAQPVRLRDFSNSTMGAPGSVFISVHVLSDMPQSASKCVRMLVYRCRSTVLKLFGVGSALHLPPTSV